MYTPPPGARVLYAVTGGADETTGITAAASNNAFLSFADTYALLAGSLYANKTILVAAMFKLTTSGTPPNLTLQMLLEKSGPTDKILFTSGAIGVSANLVTRSVGYIWTIMGTAAPGASVSVDCGTLILPGTSAALATVMNTVDQPVTAVDTASNQAILLQAKWSTNTAANTLFLQQMLVMALN